MLHRDANDQDTGSEFRHDDADMDEEDDGGGGKEVEVEKTSNKITFDRDDTALYDDEGELIYYFYHHLLV